MLSILLYIAILIHSGMSIVAKFLCVRLLILLSRPMAVLGWWGVALISVLLRNAINFYST